MDSSDSYVNYLKSYVSDRELNMVEIPDDFSPLSPPSATPRGTISQEQYQLEMRHPYEEVPDPERNAAIAPKRLRLTETFQETPKTKKKESSSWGVGFSGHDFAINLLNNDDMVSVNPIVTQKCPICAKGPVGPSGMSLADCLEPIVKSGTMNEALIFVKEVAPEIASEEIMSAHMDHGIKDSLLLDRHMTQNLIKLSYDTTKTLGKQFAMKAVCVGGEMIVPNKNNLCGMSNFMTQFEKLIKLKYTIEDKIKQKITV